MRTYAEADRGNGGLRAGDGGRGFASGRDCKGASEIKRRA
jgi:hypothetical protein